MTTDRQAFTAFGWRPISAMCPTADPREGVRGGSCPFAIFVPGGGVNALKAMGNERIVDYLRFAAHGAEIVGSVSTGAFLLAAAGLLEGRQATTHPSYGEFLQRLGANYVRRNWVEDGRCVGGNRYGPVPGGQAEERAGSQEHTNRDRVRPSAPVRRPRPKRRRGRDRLATTLAEHRTDLERALAGRPDLYQRSFG